MISAGYGGGTANMEYMSLTGLDLSNFSPTLPTPYTQLVTHRKYNPNIAQSFQKQSLSILTKAFIIVEQKCINALDSIDFTI